MLRSAFAVYEAKRVPNDEIEIAQVRFVAGFVETKCMLYGNLDVLLRHLLRTAFDVFELMREYIENAKIRALVSQTCRKCAGGQKSCRTEKLLAWKSSHVGQTITSKYRCRVFTVAYLHNFF